jgi:L-ascorbate oxidase
MAAASPVAELDTAALRNLAEANGPGDTSSKSQSSTGDGSIKNPKKYKLDVAVGNGAPDCVSRKVILVNGEFEPRLVFTQGDWVEVVVTNNIPADWPSVSKGISIHYHGFSMKGHAWMDGSKFISQCPIPAGSSFTYKFQVNEMPGTYFWHDHSSVNRADGLQGPLIVRAKEGTPDIVDGKIQDTFTLFVHDWWHNPGNALAMRLNRPFDPTKQTPEAGAWCWVGVPKSLLVNGKGNYYECEDVYTRQVNQSLPNRSDGYIAAAKDLMTPNGCVAGALGPTAEPTACAIKEKSTCKREVLTVEPNSLNRIRIINAGTLVYTTVCFEKHDVTVVALDAAPVEPKTFKECVDVNTGQRVDVTLKASQAAGSYWISVGSQYRKGAPATYAVLKYKNSKSGGPNPANIVQPGPFDKLKWNISEFMAFKPNKALLTGDTKNRRAAPYLAPNAPLKTFKVPTKVDRRVVLQSTQPLIEVNGILRWALGSVAAATSPPCKPVIDLVYDNPKWAAVNALPADAKALDPQLYFTQTGGGPSSWEAAPKGLQVIDDASDNKDTVINLGKPGAANHVLTLQPGEVVELVIQNDRAGLFGGEYNTSAALTSNRNGREQHSFHLHGHHFWQVGMGLGGWSADKVDTAEYNLVDPHLRDTTTVLFNGTTQDKAAWVAFRFIADNPGVWPMHCHIAWHEFMGQGIQIIEDPAAIAKASVPPGMPTCPEKCIWNNANFNPKAVNEVYGKTGLLAPDDSNLVPVTPATGHK